MSEVRAKFSCRSVEKTVHDETAHLSAVDDGNQENKGFNDATPYANLEIMIDNPDAQGYFEPGEEYYLDFTRADK